jgi:hypothetical protein
MSLPRRGKTNEVDGKIVRIFIITKNYLTRKLILNIADVSKD